MDFTQKCRYVSGGHVTNPNKSGSYSSVVSRDSVCIDFLIAAFNELNLLSADVNGAYLQAKNREKTYTVFGPEFGPDFEG